MLENCKFNLVALSETSLKDNEHQYEYVQISGYNTVFRSRENKKGGGVGFYVKDYLSFTLRNDITKMDDSIEAIWIEVRGKKKLLFLSVHFTNLAPMRKKSNLGWKSVIV